MDGQRFDEFARLIGAGASRRRILKLFGGGLIAGIAPFASRGARPASAQACGSYNETCDAVDNPCCEGLICTSGGLCVQCEVDGDCDTDWTCASGAGLCFEGGICGGLGSECVAISQCCRGLTCFEGQCDNPSGLCMADGDYCGDEGLECCGGDNVVCDRFCTVLCTADGDACADVEDGNCCNECIDGVCGTAAPTATSVTIHKATCHANVGADIFEQCHDNVLGGVGFSIAGIGVMTGSDGVATADVGAGSVTVVEDEASFVKYLGAFVFCSEQSSGDVLFTGSADTGLVTFNVAEGDEVVCDWYNLTAATAPDDDDDDVVKLPATGIAESGSGMSALLGVGLAAAAAYVAGRKLRESTTAPTEYE